MNHLNSFITVCAFTLISLTAYTSALQGWNGTNVCCNGLIGDQATQGCCGVNDTILYNTTNNMCCGNQVMPTPTKDAGNYSCCSNGNNDRSAKLYNYYTQVCCDGGMIMKKDKNKRDMNFGCCGTGRNMALYDYSTSGCCGNEIYDTSKSTCCGNKVVGNPRFECCDEKSYDPEKKICVYDYKHGKTTAMLKDLPNKHSAACGTTVYDMRKKVCCSDEQGNPLLLNTKKALKSPGCCQSNMKPFKTIPYDAATQVCCNSGNVLDMPSDATQYDNYQCCGSQTYNMSSQACCNNEDVYEQDPNNPGTCCGNTFHAGKPGGFGYVCCNGDVSPQAADYTTSCCNDKVTYNSTEKICCGEGLKKLKNVNTGCCLSKDGTTGVLYDYAKYECPMYELVRINYSQMMKNDPVTKLCGKTFRTPVYYD